jgi:hypothetical protein
MLLLSLYTCLGQDRPDQSTRKSHGDIKIYRIEEKGKQVWQQTSHIAVGAALTIHARLSVPHEHGQVEYI